MVVKPASNPGAVALTIVNAGGTFNGTFSLKEPGGTYLRSNIAFQGVIIPNMPKTGGGTEYAGAGYFLLNQIPTTPGVTLTTSPILSGQVNLLPFP